MYVCMQTHKTKTNKQTNPDQKLEPANISGIYVLHTKQYQTHFWILEKGKEVRI